MSAAKDTSNPKTFFGCAYCDEAFAEKSQLEVHEKMTHPDAPFVCVPAPMPEREKRLLTRAPTSAISKGMPLSEVARHCIPEDCWVALNGKVYDLTEFMDRHPGGPTTILRAAGTDASKMFNDIHKGIKLDMYLLPEAFVGDLGIDEDLMSESFWHTLRLARIREIQEELKVVADAPIRNVSVPDVLKERNLDTELKAKLQSLETQKRVALDTEDYEKALEIKKTLDNLLASDGKLAPPASGGSGIPLSEVARHNKPHDCWVALNNVVYDLTDVITHHPEHRKPILMWAGRDASPMWDKLPGRFPSKNWMDFFMRPEARIGEVGPEPKVDPKAKQLQMLQDELHRLEGPSEEEIQAAKAGASRTPAAAPEASKQAEESRFPRLKEVVAGKTLPYFTRAEVAKHKGPPGGPAGTEPYMILHNKVYDLTPLLGFHPGGDDVLLSMAGADATKEFEVFEHSEKARVRRDQDMLIGELVPAECSDWTAEAVTAALEGVEKTPASELARYLRYKATDVVVGVVSLYAYRSWQNRKPLSQFTYSRGLRHLHLIMALGIFGSLGSAQAAARTEGLTKKKYLAIHKQTGLAMLFALAVRFILRLRSGIPPRFPGNPMVQFVETQSLRLFYLLLLALPLSGVANEYYLKWAPGAERTGKKEDDERNDQRAKQAIDAHKVIGKFFEFVWLPFHLGYTTAYHYSQGRGVVRKVSPFI